MHRASPTNEECEVLFAQAFKAAQNRDYASAGTLYLQLLEHQPSSRPLLGNLGLALWHLGKPHAALTVFQQGLALFPNDPFFLVHLAHIFREQGRFESARIHYASALTQSPTLAPAHQGLAYVLDALGRREEASSHRQQGFAETPIVTLPFHGPGAPISMALLLSAVGGNVVTETWLDDHRFQVTAVFTEYCQTLPTTPFDIVFNAIGDADRARSALTQAVALIRGINARVINPPERVLATGRLQVRQRLNLLPGLLMPKMSILPKAALSGPTSCADVAKALGFSFPWLIRRLGFHSGHHFHKISEPSDLERLNLRGSEQDWVLIQYIDTASPDGLFRKYRMMMIDHQLYPLHLAISRHWNVHYGSSQSASTDFRKTAEESQFLSDPEKHLGPRVMATLKAVEQELGLDYGGIDFALDIAGHLVVFEANATMTIAAPVGESPSAMRQHALAQAKRGLRQMLEGATDTRGSTFGDPVT